MPNKEAVVVILDANESMATKVTMLADQNNIANDQGTQSITSSSKTRFDCAKEASIAIICDLMVRSKTNEATVIVLHTETTNNHFYEEDDDTDDDVDVFCPFPGLTELSGNGQVMGIRQPLPDLLRKIQQLKPYTTTIRRKGPRSTEGDFESGLVYATDALHRRTAGKKFDRRIVLLTDAEHRVGNTKRDSADSDCESCERIHHEKNVSQQRLLVALDSLRAMDCRIEVVGMDFELAADFDAPASGPSEIKEKQSKDGGDNTTDSDTDGSESESESCDDEDVGILEIKRENEEYLIRLANTTGGFVYASKELQGMLQKVLGSRVVENPSKRKLIVEIAPGLVLKDARYYKLISKTASMPLKKKLIMVDDPGSHSKISSIEAKKNTLGEVMLQDYETVNTRWNAEDENEELLEDRITHAYRFGSDLLPFSYLDEAGLKQRSPVKLTILGYVPESSIPHYLRIDSPYVLTGNESRRCCAAISALATGLHRQKKVAIATFVKGVDKDPILCGLFPLLDNENDVGEIINGSIKENSGNQQPLRLIIMQLPFSGDVRYPHLDYPESCEKDGDEARKNPAANCCDDLIDKLMLPQDALDYKHIPNHKVRSFYKTVVKRVLDKSCDVVPTRIDLVSGTDSMDTPLEIKQRAQSAVAAFYETFRLTEKTRDGDGL